MLYGRALVKFHGGFMIFYVLLALASLFGLLLFLPVKFIISYKDEISVSFRFLFIKKKIPIDTPWKGKSVSSFLGELSGVKDKIFDLYGKLNGKIKIARLEISASVGIGDAFFFPLIFGAVNGAVGAFLATLDSTIGINKKRCRVSVKCANLDTPAAIFGKIILKASLFNFLFASTYTFFKALFKGGKNGRKQAK